MNYGGGGGRRKKEVVPQLGRFDGPSSGQLREGRIFSCRRPKRGAELEGWKINFLDMVTGDKAARQPDFVPKVGE